jgi:pyridoxamine 5'-phosphate oxidase
VSVRDSSHPLPPLPIAAPAESLPASLDDLLDDVWTRMVPGAWTPWGLPVLATCGPDGAPQARTVALRAADRVGGRMEFHTDARSAKAEALRAHARATVLVWDPATAIQVRFGGIARLHHGDGRARAAWADASPLSRAACAVDAVPSTPLPAATAFGDLPQVDGGDGELAFARFALIVFEAEEMDWLWIGTGDLRRARFFWNGSAWVGYWAAP